MHLNKTNNDIKHKPKWLLKPLAIMLATALVGCQSLSTTSYSPSAANLPPATQAFLQYQQTYDAAAKQTLAQAMVRHLSQPRQSLTTYYYQVQTVDSKDSLNANADPLWLSILKMYRYDDSETPSDHAFRHTSDYIKIENDDELYLRYYDEMDGTKPSDDYNLTRTEAMAEDIQNMDERVYGLFRRYTGCITTTSSYMDNLIKDNPAITNRDEEVQKALAELSHCISVADGKAAKLSYRMVGYQISDTRTLRHCATNFQKHLNDALSPTRSIRRYEDGNYDSYDSAYGNYWMCSSEFSFAYQADPVVYMQNDTTKTMLELIKYGRLCAISHRSKLDDLAGNGQTYANNATAYEQVFYEYLGCLGQSAETVYHGESAIDILQTQTLPSTMEQADEYYELYKQIVDIKEKELYEEDEEDESVGFLGRLFERYAAMKKAEARRQADDDNQTVGIGGVYGAMADEFFSHLKKTPEQLVASNLYQYNHSRIELLSQHDPDKRYYQGVLSLTIDAPTTTQSLSVPLQMDFGRGQLVADLSAALPVGVMLMPKHTPPPEAFAGQLGVVRFSMPKAFEGVIPLTVVYDAINQGAITAINELNPTLFSAVDIGNDAYARQFGATSAVKLHFGSHQMGEFYALLSKQVIQRLSAYVDDNAELYNLTTGQFDDVAAELEHKKRSQTALTVKKAIERWALIDKGFQSSDVGGLLAIAEAILPINLYQVNYYYLDNQGNIVAQVINGQVDNHLDNSRMQMLGLVSYRKQDVSQSPLYQKLLPNDIQTLDGNEWLGQIRQERQWQKMAEEARCDYHDCNSIDEPIKGGETIQNNEADANEATFDNMN